MCPIVNIFPNRIYEIGHYTLAKQNMVPLAPRATYSCLLLSSDGVYGVFHCTDINGDKAFKLPLDVFPGTITHIQLAAQDYAEHWVAMMKKGNQG